MRYAKIDFLPVPVVVSGDASATTPATAAGRLLKKQLQVSNYTDGTWLLEIRTSAGQAWATLATVSGNGITDLGDKPGHDARIRCTVAPSAPNNPPKITLGGMDPAALAAGEGAILGA